MPSYTYDASASRYRDTQRGTFVAVETVHQWTIDVTQAAGKYASDLTGQLRDGTIQTAEWQTAMMQLVKDTHLAAAIAANGGTEQMTFADYGRTGQIIRQEYAYLRNLADGLADGSIPFDGRVTQRAEQYARAGRSTYSVFTQIGMQDKGFDEESNILGVGEKHCPGCVEAEDAGWVPIGELVPIGDRDCLQNCRCRISYRRSSDGAEA